MILRTPQFELGIDVLVQEQTSQFPLRLRCSLKLLKLTQQHIKILKVGERSWKIQEIQWPTSSHLQSPGWSPRSKGLGDHLEGSPGIPAIPVIQATIMEFHGISWEIMSVSNVMTPASTEKVDFSKKKKEKKIKNRTTKKKTQQERITRKKKNLIFLSVCYFILFVLLFWFCCFSWFWFSFFLFAPILCFDFILFFL